MSGYWQSIAIFALILMSAFFSATEISYTAVNRNRLKRNSGSGKLKDRLAIEILDNSTVALSTVLIGNNLVNMASSAFATLIAMSRFGSIGVAYSTFAMTAVILVFGEIVPKIIAKEHSESFAIAASIPLRIFMFLFYPLVWLVSKAVDGISHLWLKNGLPDEAMTAEEFASIIEHVEDEGIIDEDRSELIQSAIEFSDITAREIATPRVDMLAIEIDDDINDIITIANDSPYTRIPVYSGSVDNIIGVLILNHLYKALIDNPPEEIDLDSILMPPCFLHKTMSLPAVLSELKRQQTHIAIVTDEYGGTLGVLTMEDVLEELVGDIWDETDEILPSFVKIDEYRFSISGDMSIYDFFEKMNLDDKDLGDEYVSVGGWAIGMLKGFVLPGDSFMFENLLITIEEVDELRVLRLKATISPDAIPGAN